MSREVGERRGVTVRGRPFVVFGFRVTDGKIVEIDDTLTPIAFAGPPQPSSPRGSEHQARRGLLSGRPQQETENPARQAPGRIFPSDIGGSTQLGPRRSAQVWVVVAELHVRVCDVCRRCRCRCRAQIRVVIAELHIWAHGGRRCGRSGRGAGRQDPDRECNPYSDGSQPGQDEDIAPPLGSARRAGRR